MAFERVKPWRAAAVSLCDNRGEGQSSRALASVRERVRNAPSVLVVNTEVRALRDSHGLAVLDEVGRGVLGLTSEREQGNQSSGSEQRGETGGCS